MKWNVVTDSSCDLFSKDHYKGDIRFASVPFNIKIGTSSFKDNGQLNKKKLLTLINEGNAGRTSCPTPEDWLEQFERPGNVIALTISSQLSGSLNSAMAAKQMILDKEPSKKIEIVDSKSAGPELALGVEQIETWIQRGLSFDDVVFNTKRFFKETHILFMLKSFNHLIANGRLGKIKALLAQTFSILGIGYGNNDGRIVIKDKTRGSKKAIRVLVKAMQADGFNGGKICISHCENPKFVEALKRNILNYWHNAEILVLPTRGLCSYYAEQGGVILSYN